MPPVRKVVENVDVSTLDDHVRPNMHPPNWRGMWFPTAGRLADDRVRCRDGLGQCSGMTPEREPVRHGT